MSSGVSSNNQNNKVVALNVKFVVHPDQREAFLEAIRRDRDQTIETEPGNLQFVLGQSTEDPSVFLLHEQYKSHDDLEHHKATPHFAEFLQFWNTQQPFVTEPVLDSFVCEQDAPPQQQRMPSNNKPGTYCLNVASCVKPEFRDEFVALMKRHQADSLAEPLCLQFEWGESTDKDKSNWFYFHEEYESRAGFEAHESSPPSPHFDRYMRFNQKNPYRQPQAVSHFTILD